MTPESLAEIIKMRRSIYPHEYLDKPIPKEVLLEIMENANYAPTYVKTEPWRFKVLQGEKKKELGHFIANFYKANTPEDKFSPMKFDKIISKPTSSSAVIAICMQRHPNERCEEWEEMAAVAMAVQNMYLTCTAHNIGCYWGTPGAAKKADQLFEMNENEKCLGFLFMGYVENAKRPQQRNSVEDKIVWLS